VAIRQNGGFVSGKEEKRKLLERIDHLERLVFSHNRTIWRLLQQTKKPLTLTQVETLKVGIAVAVYLLIVVGIAVWSALR
jgi:hypothetical protein